MRDRVAEMQADLCKTLGSPTRIAILKSLEDGEKTVGQLCRQLVLNQANVSQHLAVLRNRRMVVTRKSGKNVYYQVSNPKIVKACTLMREVLLEQFEETKRLTMVAVKARSVPRPTLTA